MKKVDFERMRTELIEIYQKFLEAPGSKPLHRRIMDYEKKWSGLSVYDDILKEKPVPEAIRKALEGLSLLYQYGTYPETHDLSDKNILKRAKAILEKLRHRCL